MLSGFLNARHGVVPTQAQAQFCGSSQASASVSAPCQNRTAGAEVQGRIHPFRLPTDFIKKKYVCKLQMPPESWLLVFLCAWFAWVTEAIAILTIVCERETLS